MLVIRGSIEKYPDWFFKNALHSNCKMFVVFKLPNTKVLLNDVMLDRYKGYFVPELPFLYYLHVQCTCKFTVVQNCKYVCTCTVETRYKRL